MSSLEFWNSRPRKQIGIDILQKDICNRAAHGEACLEFHNSRVGSESMWRVTQRVYEAVCE